jgi:hypothetical protein
MLEHFRKKVLDRVAFTSSEKKKLIEKSNNSRSFGEVAEYAEKEMGLDLSKFQISIPVGMRDE